MARCRNLKPGFFKNEDLAECSPWARLCFAGLWTLADRAGRLEDRPKRIKGELFAFDSVDVEPLLDELVRHRFIVRYAVEGRRLIQIEAFERHQHPHHREPASELPAQSKPEASTPTHRAPARVEPEALPTSQPSQAPAEPWALTPSNDVASASSPPDATGSSLTDTDSGIRNTEQRTREPPTASGVKGAKRSRRCPSTFVVDPAVYAEIALECRGVNLARETAKFRDCEFKTARCDWNATWRTWIRKAADNLSVRNGTPQSFRERDEAAALAKYRGWTGGRPDDSNVIEMESENASLLGRD